MKVQNVIDKQSYPRVIFGKPLEIAEQLRQSPYILVTEDNFTNLCVISRTDFANSADLTNLKYLKDKSRINPEDSIIAVQKTMRDLGTDSLAIYDGVDFLGIITLSKITNRFAEIITERQGLYQQVIHDLRNPIGNLRGLINLLKGVCKSAEALEILELLDQSGSHALDILTDLLFVETDENKPLFKEATELNQFYRDCIAEQYGLSATKRIRIEVKLADDKIIKNVDRVNLKRAVQNLIGNAIKFSYPDSVVTISSWRKNERLILKISDNGIGIPKEYYSDIFKQFTRFGRPGTFGEPSTGLGLCFSKKCVEQHNGELYFQSDVAKGTEFYLAI